MNPIKPHRAFKTALRCSLAFLLILQSTGCAYKGMIRHDFYKPQVLEGKKLPFKVAVAIQISTNTAHYQWNDVGPCELDLEPGFTNAVATQMSVVFDSITITEDTTTFKGADFFVLASLGKGDPGSLKVTVRDVPSGKMVATYSNSTPITVLCPFFSCGVPVTLSIFSLCLLCPGTIPWALHGSAGAMREQIEISITKNLNQIAQKIKDDEARLAARGKPIPPALQVRTVKAKPVTKENQSTESFNKFFHDGAYLAASPMRLSRDDIPMALGIAALMGGAFALDQTTHNNLVPSSDSGAAKNLRSFGDVGQFSGPILGVVFAIHGWKTDNPQSKKTAGLAVESFLWAGAIEIVTKSVVGRKRPSVVDDPFTFKMFQSNGAFPSGHTTTAFAAATVFAEQYPTWKVVVPAYAAASAVGFSRIYANQHWGSDVLIGALLGIGVSHTLRKLYDRPNEDWHFIADPHGLTLCRRF